MRTFRCLAFGALLATQGLVPGTAQESNLDSYYTYPVAAGPGYSTETALSAFAGGFRLSDVSAQARSPWPGVPSIQGVVRAGLLSAVQPGSSETGPWNHTLVYGQAGAGWSHRFSKNLELGVTGLAGAGQSAYPNLVAGGPVGSPELTARASAQIGLLPSNSFSIALEPDLTWRKTLGPLSEFDGLSYGLGLQVLWRFGDDPDAPTRAFRSLEFGQDRLPAAFSAMQSYYSLNALGKVTLTNVESAPLTDLEVTFFQPGYMDSPTPVASIPKLAPRGAVEVPVRASFNNQVFQNEGMTPLVGTLTVRYRVGGRPVEQSHSLGYDLYDKTAIVWDDDRKVGAFVTPADSALRNYVGFVKQSLKEESLPEWNGPVQTAAQVWAGLGRLGLVYQADPTSPFTRVQSNSQQLDSVNLARQTLVRGSGDCDDLTVLFCSLLESSGVETGFITVPGHIYAAVRTTVAPASYRALHPDRNLSIAVGDSLWIPVEITLIGRSGFLEAWKQGAQLWHLYDDKPSQRNFVRTADAQRTFAPVVLREADLGLQYGSREELRKQYRDEVSRLGDAVVAQAAAAAQTGGRAELSALGMTYVRFGRLKDAETTFQKALKANPGSPALQVNLGNLAYLQKDFKKAAAAYQAAMKGLEDAGRGRSPLAVQTLLNLAKADDALQNGTEARAAFARAEAIDSGAAREFGSLAEAGTGRAAAQNLGPRFVDDAD